MKFITRLIASSVLSLMFCVCAQARSWEDLVKLPEEAVAVLTYQKWKLPLADGGKEVMARVKHMHAGMVTLELKGGRKSKPIRLGDFDPKFQKLAFEWREWKPRTVHFSDVKEIKNNEGKSFKAKLVATVGSDYAIYKQSGSSGNKNGYHCLKLNKIEPYERLRIYRNRFQGEFEPMETEGKDGEKLRNLGLKAYRWLPSKGDAKKSIVAQLHVPELRSSIKKVPLVVFLHGRGEAGSDNTYQLRHDEILSLIKGVNKRRYPCFLLCPQHPKGQPWFGHGPGKPRDSMIAVTHMVKMLIHDYPQIDPSRIYVTGLSSGGKGSLEFLTCWPNTYAAAVSMAASLKPHYFNENNARPFWAIWNKADLPGAEKTLKEVAKLYRGWRVKMKTTMYDKGGHNTWSEGYTEKGFVRWMFSQQLGKRR